MAATAWKPFRFFNVAAVRIAINDDDGLSLHQNNLSCIAAGDTDIIVGTPQGSIRLLNQSFKVAKSWKAHESGSVTHVKQIPGSAYLLTLAETLSQEPELKVWHLGQTEKKTGSPKCLSTTHVQNGRRNFPVSAFASASNLNQVAVGFGNGAVTMIRGDFIHDRGTKQRTVFESEEPITGLEFREANTMSLFIGTTSRILVLSLSGKAQGTPARTLEDNGCAVGCMTMNTRTNEIIVARDDAIYTYGIKSKGSCSTHDGPKKLVGISNDYTLLVSRPNNNIARSAPLRSFGGTQAAEILNSSSFNILNTNFKFIAHSEALSSEVNSFFTIWGDIFLLMTNGEMHRYHEKTFQQKLEILYQRNLYQLAIDLARQYQVDAVQKNLIYRKYGDYMYQKGDFNSAMQFYLQAIDSTEPSQIIRKFLDNQRIQNLIEYLEQLHEHDKATSDHTTLLLNCYAKLKDVEKLEDFIRQPGELKFDLDTAIIMCRQGQYFDQAAFLARRHNEHGLVVDILVEDLKKYAEAMAYIVRLEPAEAYDSLMKFGTVLLEHCPQETTTLFIDYFTGSYRPRHDAIIVKQVPPTSEGAGFGMAAARSAVQNLAALIPLPNMNIGLMSSRRSDKEAATQEQTQIVEDTSLGEHVPYEAPSPREAFSSFIDHTQQFIVFLEACLESPAINQNEKEDLYTTLFEMYLQKASTSQSEEKVEWQSKARTLIESSELPINTSNALLLSDLENFEQGTVLVSERQGRHADVFRSYVNARDTKGALKALRKYGPEDPQLYFAALTYFTSSSEVLEEVGDEMDDILKKIEEGDLMAPLQVIQLLSGNDVAPMGLIKKFLTLTVERERAEIEANRRLISAYQADTAQKLQEMQDLKDKPVAFSATRCSHCGGTLDLPTIHFLCKHSFHQRCLDISDGQDVEKIECPKCTPQNQTMRQIRQAQEESATRHDLFLDELHRSRDKFGTVSEWFGRGVMNVPTSG